jgi:hypothetical protein
MGLGMPLFSAGTAVEATDIVSRVEDVEDFLNGGVVTADLQSSPAWVQHQHIYKPEFYGAPDSHVVAVSARTHWRQRGHDQYDWSVHHTSSANASFVSINGLAATVYVPNVGGAANCFATILASFYAYEWGGFATADESILVATFSLFVNGAEQTGTARTLFSNANAMSPSTVRSRKQHGIIKEVSLNEGIHHIDVRVKVEEPALYNDGLSLSQHEHIIVAGRNLVIDLAVK